MWATLQVNIFCMFQHRMDIQSMKITSSKMFCRFFFQNQRKKQTFYRISSEKSNVIGKAIYFCVVPSTLKYMNRSRIKVEFSQHSHPQASCFVYFNHFRRKTGVISCSSPPTRSIQYLYIIVAKPLHVMLLSCVVDSMKKRN